MNELNGDGTFANARGDALGRAAANITGGEDARETGFEQIGITIETSNLWEVCRLS